MVLYTIEEHNAKKLISTELQERSQVMGKVSESSIKKLNESAEGKKGRKLIVKMEAIHVGRTRNFTYYTEEGLKAGINSWTSPHRKPILVHHNTFDGEPIGRINQAEFSNDTPSGRPGLIFTVEISDSDAIEKVLDGRYSTVSIGASASQVTCNICGTNRTEKWCNHYPGRTYEEQTCHLIIGETHGREVSYVNVPSDEHAGNISAEFSEGTTGEEQGTKEFQMIQVAENLCQNVENPTINLYEHLTQDLKNIVDKVVEGENKVKGIKSKEGSENQMGIENTGASRTIEEATQEINDLTNKVNTLQESVSNLVLEKQKVDNQLEEARVEGEKLIDKVAELEEAAHLHLVEKVVDLKTSLRRSDVIGVTREEAIEEHSKRTGDSLEDTLLDLMAESKKSTVEPGSVKNPGYTTTDGDTDETKDDGLMPIQEAVELMKNMFGGKSNK